MTDSKSHLARFAVLAAASALFTTAATAATTLFQFGESSSYVSSGQAFRQVGGSPVTTTTYDRDFSESWSLSPISNYSGPLFYGGWENVSGGLSASSAANQVINNLSVIGSNDGLLFRYQPSSTSGADVSYLVVSELTSSLPFSDLQNFGIKASKSSAGGATVRAVIKADGNYYVGANSSALGNTYPASPASLDIAAANWLTYDPLTSIGTLGSGSSLLGSASVSSVGFLIERTTGTNAQIDTYVGELSVTAVPEPASLAIIAGLSAAAFVAFRRRRRA